VITSDLLDEAMTRYMPKGAKAATKLAREHRARAAQEKSDLEFAASAACRPSRRSRWLRVWGGGKTFQVISPEMVEEIIEGEAAPETETTYTGGSSLDARSQARAVDDPGRLQAPAHQARIEKAARLRRSRDR